MKRMRIAGQYSLVEDPKRATELRRIQLTYPQKRCAEWLAQLTEFLLVERL